MTETENIDQNTRQVGEALLAVANSLQEVAKIMLGGDASDKTDKKKVAKKDKDPDAPKRNLTSYIYYVQEVRERIAQENPSLSAVDVARILGEKWNSLTDKEKQPYIKKAAVDKTRFDREMDTYRQEKGIPAPEPKKKKSAPAPVESTKRPAPAAAEAPVANKKKAKQDKKKANKKK